MADNNKILKERVELVQKIKKIQEEQGKEAAKLDRTYIVLKGRLQEIVSQLQEQRKEAMNITTSINNTVNEASSLSSVYGAIKSELGTQRKLQTSIAEVIAEQKINQGGLNAGQENQHSIAKSILDKYSKQADIATEISKLSEDNTNDIIKRADLINEQTNIGKSINEEIKSLDKRYNISKQLANSQSDIESSIKRQTDEAIKLSNLTTKQKDILEEQAKIFDTIGEKIESFGSTLTTFLQKPGTAIGALVVAVGHLEHKISDVNQELGFTFLDMNSAAKSAGVLSFIFNDTVSTVKALSKEFGTLESATLKTQFQVNAMSSLMGISNTEASQLVGQFARMNGGSTGIAADMVQTTKEYAKQNNVIPSDVLADLAGSAEEFALFAKDGGKNLIMAATQARKLGTDMGTLSGIAEGLLDFESSMTKELELGVMLGRNINLNKARQLAYDGKIGDATEEVLRQVGGIEAFNKMDYFQKKATAQLLGVSVAELQKMADNQQNIGTMGSVVNEQFSEWKASLNMITNKYLGHGIEVLGGWIATSAQVGANFDRLGIPVKGLVTGTGKVLANLWEMTGGKLLKGLGALGGKLTGALGETNLGKTGTSLKDKILGKATEKTPKIETDSVSDKINKTTSGKGMNVTNMLKGAAAILVLSAALYVAAKAFQEFGDVEWNAVGLGLTGLAGLATIAFILGKAQGEMIKGAIAVGILGAALIPFSFAMNLISGIDMGSVLSVAAGLVIFSAAVFGLGALMSSGVGAFLFGAGLIALSGLGIAMGVLGAGMIVASIGFEKFSGAIDSVVSIITKTTNTLKEVGTTISGIVSMVGGIGIISLAFAGLGISLVGLGVASLVALPGVLGITAVIGVLALSTSLLSTSIKEMISTLTSLTSISDIISNLGGMIGTIALVSLSFLGLGISLTGLGISSLVALPGLIGLSIVLGTIALSTSLLSSSLQTLGKSITQIISSISSLSTISTILGNLGGMIGTIALVSLSFVALGISLAGLGVSSLLALPGLVGLSIVLGMVALSTSLLSGSIKEMMTTLTSLTNVSSIISNLGSTIGTIGMLSLAFLGLGASLIGLGISGLIALPALFGISFALMIMSTSIGTIGSSIESIVGSFSTMDDLGSKISNLVTMASGIGVLSLAFTGLAASLVAVGTAGLVALPALVGLSMASTGLSIVADIFGLGSSSKETTAVEKGSISEYETKMLQKMDELIGAVKSNRDVYIDKDKITKVLSKSLEKRTENLIGLSVA